MVSKIFIRTRVNKFVDGSATYDVELSQDGARITLPAVTESDAAAFIETLCGAVSANMFVATHVVEG